MKLAPHSKGPGQHYPRSSKTWWLMCFANHRAHAIAALQDAKKAVESWERRQQIDFAREWGAMAREAFARATA